MALIDSDSEKVEQQEISESSAARKAEAEEISWLIDNLPVTVFRVSNEASWVMFYISKNVEELSGYSKKDFLDQK
ncbi:MAG: hypothetical protein PHU28_06735 [Methanosarcinaceae archaeon]|nr:hypothetical protein [Methanosarcinaceae archaeon]